jgi:hypothetical protein
MKTWLECDIEDVQELRDYICVEIGCENCQMNRHGQRCLGEIADAMKITLDMINKGKRGLEEYV